VVATYAFHKQAGVFRTFMGTTVADAMAAAYEAGASIAGANCGTDLSLGDYLDLGVEMAAAAAGRPTILQPNAGAPRTVDGGICYDATPVEMADLAGRLRRSGITIIGGCCGTTPAHLAAIAASG
jgi:methionine synthase I (cobalamin-dependent)